MPTIRFLQTMSLALIFRLGFYGAEATILFVVFFVFSGFEALITRSRDPKFFAFVLEIIVVALRGDLISVSPPHHSARIVTTQSIDRIVSRAPLSRSIPESRSRCGSTSRQLRSEGEKSQLWPQSTFLATEGSAKSARLRGDGPLAALGSGRNLAARSDRAVSGLLFLHLLASSLAVDGLAAGATDPALELAFLALFSTDDAAPHGVSLPGPSYEPIT